jgi:uncharacterized protein
MIIDADCHISSHKFDGLAITADELVAQMDRAGVERAVVWLKPPYAKDIAPENRAVYEATRRYPGRLLGFGWANPRLGRAHAEETIARCFEEYGFYGIKFNGAQDDYLIDDPELALPLVERAARYARPLAFHIGADFYENTHPYRLGAIAARFPETPLLMIHMGGAALPPLDRSAIEVAERHQNITIIGSAIPEQPVLRAIDRLGASRVCFGSDAPFRLMHVQLAMYQALLRDHGEDDRALVLGGNIARLLGLVAA